MTAAGVRLERDGAVATLVLDRPETRNALSVAMGTEVDRLVSELRRDATVRVVILRGEGAGFSSGGDLAFIDERRAATADENRRAMRAFYMRFLSLRTLEVPTIAAMHGTTMGAGVCVALACDLRVAAKGARLALNFVRLGLPPGMGATLMLPRLVGPAKACELLLTGKVIDADEALRIGLVNAVAPPETLLAAARAMADEIASAAPRSVALTLRALRRWTTAELDAALEAEAEGQASEYASNDLVEGIRAARERRTPSFKGS